MVATDTSKDGRNTTGTNSTGETAAIGAATPNILQTLGQPGVVASAEERQSQHDKDKALATDVATRLVAEAHRVGRPVCPPGGREELLDALTRAVANPGFGTAFTETLASERQRLGVGTTHVDDIPEAEILRGGFGCLSDDDLATVAIDPGVVDVLTDLVTRTGPWAGHDPAQVGQWFTDAVMREYGPESEDAREEPATPKAHVPSARRNTSSAGVWAAAVAASFIIGITCGALLFRGAGEKGRETVTVLAFARAIPTKGADSSFEVVIESPRTGFATLVLLRQGKPARVYPDYGEDDIAVKKGEKQVAGPIEATPGEVVLIVITETPAAESVRRAVKSYDRNPGSAPELESRVNEALWGAGYKWVAVAHTSVIPVP